MIEHGMPDIIQVRRTFCVPKRALVWEQKVLRRMRVLYNNKWLNKNASGAIELDERIRKLMSDAKKGCMWVHKDGHKTLIRKELLSSYLSDGYVRGHGQKNSGSLNGMYGKQHTRATRQKISAARKGINTNTPEQCRIKSENMRTANPMHNPDIKRKYDIAMKTCRRSSKYVYFNGTQYESVKAACKAFPHIKYSTLAFWCANKKGGWSYDPPALTFASESTSQTFKSDPQPH